MNEFVYNSAVQAAGRRPTLWIYIKGKLYTFSGESIPGVVEVVTKSNREIKMAKSWSAEIYHLNLAEEAVPCVLLASMHGRLWPEVNVDEAWNRFRRQFGVEGVSSEVFLAAMWRDFPLTYDRLGTGERNPWIPRL